LCAVTHFSYDMKSLFHGVLAISICDNLSDLT